MYKYILLIASFSPLSSIAQSTLFSEQHDISYYNDTISVVAIRDYCKLDIYYPQNDSKNLPVIIWFHGGGLTSGQKEIPGELKTEEAVIVGVGYRLIPEAQTVYDIIADAAKAVAWVKDSINNYGGNSDMILLSGHSAGAYLSLMLGLNSQHLNNVGINNKSLLGIVALSPQTITHFAARKQNGISELQPVVDELSPLYWSTNEAPPISLITGDRELEMLGRYEENAYLARMLKLWKHPYVTLYELDGYGHNMTTPAFPLLINEMKKMIELREK